MHMATLSYVTIKHGPSAACVGQAFRRHKKLEEAQVSSDLNFLKDYSLQSMLQRSICNTLTPDTYPCL